jgi:hypothetical protein
MRRLAVAVRRPVVALPVDRVRRRLAVHALPPDVAVIRERDVGEDRVGLDRFHRRRIGRVGGAGRHPEVTGLGIDGVDLAVGAGLDPGDVIADRRHLPTLVLESLRRHHHGEVGLAAGAREGRGNVGFLALRVRDPHDQHVLREPALVAGHVRGDAQRQALFAQQRVAAVARTVGPDLARLGKMHDVLFVGIARPRHVRLPVGQGGTDRVHAGHEVAVLAEHVDRTPAHARHDAHVDHHVG